jgi:uracil-DNA glycosylase
MTTNKIFDQDCRKCERLADFLCETKRTYPDYHARPVAPFGDQHAELLIVGLAPGMHGANATGRPFTGDHAGILLYETLYEFGYSNKPRSESLSDGLQLRNCRITNAVKCLPPQNKPTTGEIAQCNSFLAAKFGHNVCHILPNGRKLVDSYHCSRYNTQTKRLTKYTFADVFRTVGCLLHTV